MTERDLPARGQPAPPDEVTHPDATPDPEVDVEEPEPDVVEQHQEPTPDHTPEHSPGHDGGASPGEIPPTADEGDALEQQRVIDTDEDEYR